MRFVVEVSRDADGVLHGQLAAEGARPTPFWGIVELVGLMEAPLTTDRAAPYDREGLP